MVVVLVEIARTPSATVAVEAVFRENGQAANMPRLYWIGLGGPYGPTASHAVLLGFGVA
jgi:hypothetical protein